MPMANDAERRIRNAMEAILGTDIEVSSSLSGGSLNVRVSGAHIAPADGMNLSRHEREQEALGKVLANDRHLLTDPTVIALARGRGLSPAELLVYVAKSEYEQTERERKSREHRTIPDRAD
jgi:hypothetical protein